MVPSRSNSITACTRSMALMRPSRSEMRAFSVGVVALRCGAKVETRRRQNDAVTGTERSAATGRVPWFSIKILDVLVTQIDRVVHPHDAGYCVDLWTHLDRPWGRRTFGVTTTRLAWRM